MSDPTAEPREPAPGDVVEVVTVDPAAIPAAEPAPRRRRRGLIAIIVVGVVLALGIVGFVVADAAAASAARDYVKARVIAVLGLPDDADVAVDLGGGSILVQLLAGRVDRVSVDVPDATFGAVAGAVEFRATGVPLDESKPVESLAIGYTVGAEALAALGGGDEGAQFEFVDGEATLRSDFELFGVTIPIGYALVPSADEGELVLTPTRLTIGETVFEPGDADDSIFGAIATALLQPQRLCIADQVPAALTLQAVEIDGENLRLDLTADGVALGSPTLSTPGTCAD